MSAGESQAIVAQKAALTPKAIINQKYGSKACYKVEEVQDSTGDGCPGLAINKKIPCLYKCNLQLPEISVVSRTFRKKKDAEQSAAELALEKLGIPLTEDHLTLEDAWDALLVRIKYLFSNEFLTSLNPLSGHFRAALQREDDNNSLVPASVIALFDSKIWNLCKSIDPKVDSNPFLAISYVMSAAARLSGFVTISKQHPSLRRQNPYPLEVIDSPIQQSSSIERLWIEAILIPCSLEKTVEVVYLDIASTEYYLDIVAKQLGLDGACKVLVSRPIGKASSETRLYFTASELYLSDLLHAKQAICSEPSFNVRASYLSSEHIYGNAILASVGYTWKSKDLLHEDLSLQSYYSLSKAAWHLLWKEDVASNWLKELLLLCYRIIQFENDKHRCTFTKYRMLMNKIPSGIYKLSREAILTADLPSTFTTKANWRGSLPRDILCTLCRQHRFSEPLFSVISASEASSSLSESNKKLMATSSGMDGQWAVAAANKDASELKSLFRCEVRILSKFQDLILKCSPRCSYKKQADSIQNASLKALLWLNIYFRNLGMPKDRLLCYSDQFDVQFYHQNLFKAFAVCRHIQESWHSETQGKQLPKPNCIKVLFTLPESVICSLKIEGPDSGVSPSNGSLPCVSYSVTLATKGENMKELLETFDEFEFEMGNGSVASHLEETVMQMTVGQSAFFTTDLPPKELILAVADDSERLLSLFSLRHCCLEYTVTLLRVTEALEDRLEQALFSPPLSKQRVNFAVQHIKESCAATLVDFGCGSGSLLDSLLNYQIPLEKIVGVDISPKGLTRAAKVLHSKLSTKIDGIKSAALYDGSITVFDCRLYGFDIGTCLEVIEHMEEDQACLFGDIVLTSFCPRILIVSTPNYEYNVILQGSNVSSQEEDADDKTQSQSPKYRNHDHKFEWTRKQFNQWATDLATRHNYSVDFSGVGGFADVEPGFASQIAVFRRGLPSLGDDVPEIVDLKHHYNVVWEWNRSS